MVAVYHLLQCPDVKGAGADAFIPKGISDHYVIALSPGVYINVLPLKAVLKPLKQPVQTRNAHIERKKSKISFILDHKPDRKEEKEIETRMNELIEEDLPVTYEYVDRNNIPDDVKLDRLPDDASETLRLVRIGDYDVCPCIGKHVRSTKQIGKFVMLGTNWDEEKRSFRVRFKIVSGE